MEGPAAMQRGLIPITTHDTGFIQYMDSGIWHLAIYNDGKEIETVSFLTTTTGERLRHHSLLQPGFVCASFFLGFFPLQRKVQVNQGEDEHYKNRNIGATLSCL